MDLFLDREKTFNESEAKRKNKVLKNNLLFILKLYHLLHQIWLLKFVSKLAKPPLFVCSTINT